LNRLRLEAPAKINLFLEVLSRRPDGYHTLSTVFQQISLADTLHVRHDPDGPPATRLKTAGADLPVGPKNLVVRAADAFRAAGHVLGGMSFHLKKGVPVGGGLGGGSSDAAAALKACWSLSTGRPLRRFPAEAFIKTARGLGADVPFFLRGGTALGAGVGEKLRPLAPPRKTWIVLVFPRVFVSTPWVFQRLRFPLTKRRSSLKIIKTLSLARSPREWTPFLFNRLEEIVLPRVPAVAQAKRALLQAGCLAALMSGSGSSVFGVVASPREGERVRERLRSRDWDLWLVHTCASNS